jgi:formylglycine-generating enzyme required for sulfatase activity
VGGTHPDGAADNFPVVNLSWDDVVKWCNAKSAIEGKTAVYLVNGEVYKSGGSGVVTQEAGANGYRLPTELEWEWAARGGVNAHGYTYSGSNNANAVAWTRETSKNHSRAVGTKSANELGIYDMSGNVLEWCWDARPNTFRRLLRGGSCWYVADLATVSWSGYYFYPDYRGDNQGFRYACSSGN